MANTRHTTSITSFLRLISCFVLFARAQTVPKKGGNKVLLLLLDGMRWDLFGADMPALKCVEENGVRLDWLDTVFPTLSSPSMFSIATGLYTESHGVVHNLVFTHTTQETYHWADAFTKPEHADWWNQPGVEPIWVTAINQGLTVGSIAYPGSQLPINDTLPTKFELNSVNYNLKERVDIAVDYFVEDDFELVLLYWVDPDDVLHKHGIDSTEMYRKLTEIDEGIEYLFNQLDQNGLSNSVDVLITSDHGMIKCDPRKLIDIYDDDIYGNFVNPVDVDFVLANYGPMFQIEPAPGKLEKVYRRLKGSSPFFQVYKRDEMPERFHYGKSQRNLQIIGIAEAGWGVTANSGMDWGKAHHGFDNKLMDMKSILFAQGPSFQKGYRARNMESVNIYPLICELLQLTPSPNNGSRENYKDMLAEFAPSSQPPSMPTAPSMPTLPSECRPAPSEHMLTVRNLSLVIMSLSLLSLVLGVTVIYYCGKYGLCKNGMLGCCEHEDEYRSHTGFISLANDIDMDDEDDEV